MKDGKRREAVEEVLKVLGVRAEMEEIRKLGGEEGKGRKMLELKSKAQKREIMRRKRELKGRGEKIIKDVIGRGKREDEVDVRRNSKGEREKEDESIGRLWKDKNWGTMVNLE